MWRIDFAYLLRRDRLPTPVFLGFPCGSAGKESACNVGDLGSIPGLGRSPRERKGYPLQYSGLKSPVDYSPQGRKESDTIFTFNFQTALKLKRSQSVSHSVMSDSLRPMEFYSRILEWVAFPFSRGSSQPRDWTQVSHIAGGFFTSWATREAQEYWSG